MVVKRGKGRRVLLREGVGDNTEEGVEGGERKETSAQGSGIELERRSVRE